LHAPGASPRSGGPARLHAIRRARDGLPHGRPAEGGRRPPPCPGEGLRWWERPRDRSKRRQRRPAKHPAHRRVPASRGHSRRRPDVVTLDAAILSRRGLASLERLMRASRTPVVLVSPPTRKGREMTLLALDLGAAGVVRMPSRELVRRMPDVVSEMLGAVKA